MGIDLIYYNSCSIVKTVNTNEFPARYPEMQSDGLGLSRQYHQCQQDLYFHFPVG